MIIPFEGASPDISADAFVAPNATIIGNVRIEAGASVWYGAVLRGDVGRIEIGARTSVQDNVVIHCNHRQDTIIGSDVTIGHAAVLEGCRIEPGCLIGMRATVLSGSVVERGSIIAAGAVVLEDAHIPPNSLAAGMPAVVKTTLSAETQERIKSAPQRYVEYSARHKAALAASIGS
jgi:carbonic anhydrase/acetyltransferase-like protein (isoleucine patch superfamily)